MRPFFVLIQQEKDPIYHLHDNRGTGARSGLSNLTNPLIRERTNAVHRIDNNLILLKRNTDISVLELGHQTMVH